MSKIIVIGSTGAGKTTFSKRLSALLHIPLYHLDLLWHQTDRSEVSREEFDKRLEEIIKREEWILDGNYQRTLEWRLRECDMVFLLDYSVDVCLLGASSRIGKKRDDLPFVEEALDDGFRRRILCFGTEKLPKIYELLDQYKDKKTIVIFKSRKEADLYLEKLSF